MKEEYSTNHTNPFIKQLSIAEDKHNIDNGWHVKKMMIVNGKYFYWWQRKKS